MTGRAGRWLAAGGCLPGLAQAHSFGQVYSLPVPVWLYLYGAAAALLLSFLVVACMAGMQRASADYRDTELGQLEGVAGRVLIGALRALALGGLALCIATGLWGTANPYGNFNMTFFWIVFVLGMAYATALVGDWYALINPWRVLAAPLPRPPLRYPGWLDAWPAVGLYAAFIWLELFGGTTPYSLACLLIGYSLLTLAGAALFGARDWLYHADFFAVFFRLLGQLAPLRIEAGSRRRLWLRPPFVGAGAGPARSVAVLVFILFMLSSTAFDGLHETRVWRQIFWVDLYHAGLQDWLGRNPLAAFPHMNRLYGYWNSFWLLASPLLYLAVYWLFIWLTRLCGGARMSTRTLALRFAPTLLPIALVYNITHYYTLLQTQGIKIISLASDPFAWGWNLFGTAGWFNAAIIPDAVFVWHMQVGLIVLGHVISVYLAHRVALEVFGSPLRAALSQLPMLVLMLAFTTAGLWILAQPISGG